MTAKKQAPLAARQVGRNVIIMIDGEKFSKKTETNEEVDEIRKKIELYNKQPSDSRLEKIKAWFTPEKKKEDEKKEMIKKGTKKAIIKERKKKTVKKAAKIADEPETGAELVEKVKEAHGAGRMTDDEIRSLQSLLAKEAQNRADQKDQDERKQHEQQSSSNYRRPYNEH